MKQALAAALLAALGFAQAAGAQLPDPTRFGIRVEMGDISQAREWLDAGLKPDFLADRIGTGLMIAAWEGNVPMMELFMSRGADINKTNAAGEQALLHAAWRGRLDAVKWLLANGAELNREPLQWTALHYAVFAGHEDVARYLIERGADINARSTNGSSVLMMAAYEGREELAGRLVALGADRSVRNDRGDGALEWAMKFNRLKIARLVARPQEFAAAASLPKKQWGEPVRSVPQAQLPAAGGEIEQLLKVRSQLAARGLKRSVDQVDSRIAALRAKRAKPELDITPVAILEISASRKAPREQKARLITERNTK
jgi:ankyrin repeat protein